MEEEKYDIKKFLLIKKVYMKFFCDRTGEDSSFFMFVEAIDSHEFQSQQEISNFLGCNKAHTSRILLKMHLKGLIKSPCKPFVLTQKGKNLVAQIEEAKSELKQKLFKNISQEEYETFATVVEKILTNAKELKKES